MIGIYKIVNLIDNKVYIGQSKMLEIRKEQHFQKLRANKHGNRYLQFAFNKYGEENFKFEIIEECENLNERETYWFNYYKPNVYNLGHTGNVQTMSEETRKKISLGGRRPCKEETKIKISLSQKGKHRRKHTPEEIEKIRQGNLGKKYSLETRQKMRISALGKKRSEESKLKNRLAHLGKKFSKEVIERRTAAHRGCIAINNGKERKWAHPENIDFYLSNGWQKGWVLCH